MRPIVLSLAALISLPCHAATLRALSTLSAPTVRLSDLFDDAGANAARVLGPGPALGGRIVVEAAQLAAIARQFGVDWRPSSPADRAVLDRPGRPLARDEAMNTIRTALTEAGASADCDIELPGFASPDVPLTGTVRIVATQTEYDPVSGRFSVVLSLTGDSMDAVSMRVAGRVQETVEAPIAASRLPSGTVLGPQDIRMARVRTALAGPDMIHDPGQAIGMSLRHPVSAGQPLPLADLVRPPVVEKGAPVQMLLDTAGITVAAQGQALESGAMGDHVRVRNPVSRAILDGEVTGPERVRIRPDSAPLVPAGRTTLAADR